MKTIVKCILCVVSLLPFFVQAQEQLLIRVTDESTGKSLSGATLHLVRTLSSQQSDTKGEARFRNLAPGHYMLQVSYIGYETKYRRIQIPAETTITVALPAAVFLADEVVVSATRAGENAATTFKNISRHELAKGNLGQDLPYLLDQTPGVVVTSDAGAGIGYTGIRIRGSDPTRVNVTINGIPYNDSESMGTFWVNMPDFASSVSNIQIQRGVGTSTNGASAFGASLNIQTGERIDSAYAALDNSYGSFNTWKNTVRLGTGLLGGRFTVDGRLSRIVSDGFIDRASSNLYSYFLSGAWHGKNSLLRANIFAGQEKTYQAWNGVPEARIKNDIAGMEAYAAADGLDEEDLQHLLASDSRRYNPYTYPNQHDNYNQSHYQLLYSNSSWRNLVLNGALHLTKGAGYYESFRKNERFSRYGLTPIPTGSEEISRTDLVRTLWLDNYFYGLTYSAEYQSDDRLKLTLGGAYNQYRGDHFGHVIWAQYASDSRPDRRYYENDAFKSDFNIFGKGDYTFGDLTVSADLQYRQVEYSIEGKDRDFTEHDIHEQYQFFNPKIGFTYRVGNNSNAYASFAIGNKEPVRSDLTDTPPGQERPTHEHLKNIEAGYRFNGTRFRGSLNGYVMYYKNQLVINGKLNDVGAALRENVDRSYRIGMEMDVQWQPVSWFRWGLTGALSSNKIRNYYSYMTAYDEDWNGSVQEELIENTHIALSPGFVGSSEIAWQPLRQTEIAFISKYVSRQYLDNTSARGRSIDPFFVNNLRLSYQTAIAGIKTVGFTLLINNLFNTAYEANGYTWGYYMAGTRNDFNFYFPQAGTNFLLGMQVAF